MVKHALRFLAAAALVATFAIAGATTEAFAQIATTATQTPVTNTTIDFAPVVNPIMQLAGLFVSAMAPIVVGFAIAWIRNRSTVAANLIDDQMRATLEGGAKVAIGWALARIPNVPAGKLTLDVKNKLVASAAQKLADDFSDTLDHFGVKDKVAKAAEIVEARLALWAAEQANGTPIPTPTGTTVAAPQNTVAVAAKPAA